MKKWLFILSTLVLSACSSNPKNQASTLKPSRFPASQGSILVCEGKTEKVEIQGDGASFTVIMTTNSDVKVINNIKCDKTAENIVQCDSFSGNEDKSDPGTGYNFQIKHQDKGYLISGTRSAQFNQRTYQQINWTGQCSPPLDQLQQ